ncbi:substrate-binding domain-containing protein [Vibrio mytili]|uniref:PBP domain-containing protein n=1 Tax=Vibrio mytili TaxID=50718 RepID=A0A0C3DL13_9VIBR|nr:substrate-binding domain-containing protein [Vibrio mytili]KIN12119.1 hypothetical protein SU60_04065 [Vibrio mytili]
MEIKRLVLLTLLLAPHVTFAAQDEQSDRMLVGVESSLVPIVEDLTQHSNDPLSYVVSDSIPADMIKGNMQVAIMSRKWTDEEISQFYIAKGYRPVRLFFMADAGVLVSHSDSVAETISFQNDATRSLYCISNLHALKNTVITDNVSSLSRCENTMDFLDRQALKGKLDSDKSAKAYIKYAEAVYSGNWDEYKTLSVQTSGNKAFAPTAENIYSGRYPFSNLYYLYLDNVTTATEGLHNTKLLKLVTSEQNESEIRDNGYISLPVTLLERNQVTLGLKPASILHGYK